MSAAPLLLLPILAGLSSQPAFANQTHAGYVGSQACAVCHAEAAAAWQDSHHDLAMQRPTAQAVLGNFNDTEFSLAGVTTRFYRDGERYMIRTDGPNGELQDYAVSYTFGVEPLQQYLIALPGGRLQAFGIAWDSRPSDAGGQRWFHLYPDDPPKAGDPLHWTGRDQNWNHMCADCHSTDLLKRYDSASDAYTTSYAELDVGCEACHGAGAQHINWASQAGRAGDPQLALRFNERGGISWQPDLKSGLPRRSEPLTSSLELDTCARCHSRRGRLVDDYRHGTPIGDYYRVATLDEGLYYPDGQILDEVFVYGSFLQSRMHDAGVTCSDCHEPHSLKLRAAGDGTCLSCHSTGDYALPTHHHHDVNSEGARCVNCHMPAKTYMVVDPRRDHSFRIPRPDLSESIGVPNACNDCHSEETAAWAARQIDAWTDGKPAPGFQRHAEALHLARQGLPQARDALLGVVRDPKQSAIARATAMTALAAWLDQTVAQSIVESLQDASPLMRRAAVQALTDAPEQLRGELLAPSLQDPVREVRSAAVVGLAGLPPGTLAPSMASAYSRALSEYRESLTLDADRPEAQVNLGVLLTQQRDLAGAEAAYHQALNLEPGHAPAVVNLVDLYRATGRDGQGGQVLVSALTVNRNAADVHHAFGLWLVRQQRAEQALVALRRAAELAPGIARYGYVLAVALHGQNQVQPALTALEGVLERHPYHAESLTAMVFWRRQIGAAPGEYAQRLLELQQLGRGQNAN
jgi:tetratricopeptide (TPR) repeat protein